MQPSVEVRWFCPGPVPEDVRRWFEAVAGVRLDEVEPERRTDAYRIPAEARGDGVKLRDGQVLEIKRLIHEIGAETWGEAAGVVREWHKRRLAVPAGLAGGGPDWVDVEKTRWEQAFAVRAGAVARVAPHARGVDLELTAVAARGAVWWSVCLEAFGLPREAADGLRAVAAHVFERPGAPRLEAAWSDSYPGWLFAEVAPRLRASG